MFMLLTRIVLAEYGLRLLKEELNLLSDIDSDRFINIYNNFPNYPRGEGKRVRYILSDTLDRMFIATTEGLMICNPSESPEEMQFNCMYTLSGQ